MYNSALRRCMSLCCCAWGGAVVDAAGCVVRGAGCLVVLGQLGYGDYDETTTVSHGPDAANKYITTYFLHTVHVTGNVGVADLYLQRDDGA